MCEDGEERKLNNEMARSGVYPRNSKIAGRDISTVMFLKWKFTCWGAPRGKSVIVLARACQAGNSLPETRLSPHKTGDMKKIMNRFIDAIMLELLQASTKLVTAAFVQPFNCICSDPAL